MSQEVQRVLTPEELKAIRKHRRLTLEQINDALQLGANTYGRWERGEVPITASMSLLVHLAMAWKPVWKRCIDELPVIPEGHHSVPVIVAYFDPCFDEVSGNGYGVSHGMYGQEFHTKEMEFLSLEPGFDPETDWVPFADRVTHWMYEPDRPAYDGEVLNPIFKRYHESARPTPPLKQI